MFNSGDIALIIGKYKSGKTTLAKTLMNKLKANYIYINCIRDIDKLENIYYSTKNIETYIIFDNYVESKSTDKIFNLFIDNINFTIIIITNYVNIKLIRKSDVIYLGKNLSNASIDIYYDRINRYLDINKNKFIEKINKLNDYGFLILDKDKRYKDEEILMKAKVD